MKIYVFGNKDIEIDNIAINVAEKLEKEMTQFQFIYHDPIQDFLPDEMDLIILDTAVGIKDVVILEDINKIQSSPIVGVHDFDLGFNLKFLLKIGQINSFKIIAVPSVYNLKEAVEKVKVILFSFFA